MVRQSKTASSSPPKYCKDCRFLWEGGIKDGEHNIWCREFGQPAKKAVNHCRNSDSRQLRELE